MRNLLFAFTLLFLIIPTLSFANESVIYNFSSKKIYYSVQTPSQYGKIQPFKKQSIYYNRKKVPLHIYTTSTIQIKDCIFKIGDRQDAFVTDKSKSIECSLRAERLPKEY